jgi:hypothetical protein
MDNSPLDDSALGYAVSVSRRAKDAAANEKGMSVVPMQNLDANEIAPIALVSRSTPPPAAPAQPLLDESDADDPVAQLSPTDKKKYAALRDDPMIGPAGVALFLNSKLGVTHQPSADSEEDDPLSCETGRWLAKAHDNGQLIQYTPLFSEYGYDMDFMQDAEKNDLCEFFSYCEEQGSKIKVPHQKRILKALAELQSCLQDDALEKAKAKDEALEKTQAKDQALEKAKAKEDEHAAAIMAMQAEHAAEMKDKETEHAAAIHSKDLEHAEVAKAREAQANMLLEVFLKAKDEEHAAKMKAKEDKHVTVLKKAHEREQGLLWAHTQEHQEQDKAKEKEHAAAMESAKATSEGQVADLEAMVALLEEALQMTMIETEDALKLKDSEQAAPASAVSEKDRMVLRRKLQEELQKEQTAKAEAVSKGGEYKTALDIMLATMEAAYASDTEGAGVVAVEHGDEMRDFCLF